MMMNCEEWSVPHPTTAPDPSYEFDMFTGFDDLDDELGELSEGELYNDLAHICEYISTESGGQQVKQGVKHLKKPKKARTQAQEATRKAKASRKKARSIKLQVAVKCAPVAQPQQIVTDSGIMNSLDFFDSYLSKGQQSSNEFGCYQSNSCDQFSSGTGAAMLWNSSNIEQVWLQQSAKNFEPDSSAASSSSSSDDEDTTPQSPVCTPVESPGRRGLKHDADRASVVPTASVMRKSAKASKSKSRGSKTTKIKTEPFLRPALLEANGAPLRQFVFTPLASRMRPEELETWRANRAVALARFRQKKAERLANPSMHRYKIRKKIANKRPRVKGRFVKTEELVSAASAKSPAGKGAKKSV